MKLTFVGEKNVLFTAVLLLSFAASQDITSTSGSSSGSASANDNGCTVASLSSVCIRVPVIQLSKRNSLNNEPETERSSLKSSTELYFASTLFPSEIQLESELDIELIHSSYSELAIFPCVAINTTFNSLPSSSASNNATLNVVQNQRQILLSISSPFYNLTRISNYVSMVSLDFSISRLLAQQVLAALQDSSLSNVFSLRISDKNKRQCLVGPTVLGQAADFVSLGMLLYFYILLFSC